MKRQPNGRKARFRSLLEPTDDGIVVLAAAGRIIDFSPTSVWLLGSSSLRRFAQLKIGFIAPDPLAPIDLRHIRSAIRNALNKSDRAVSGRTRQPNG